MFLKYQLLFLDLDFIFDFLTDGLILYTLYRQQKQRKYGLQFFFWDNGKQEGGNISTCPWCICLCHTCYHWINASWWLKFFCENILQYFGYEFFTNGNCCRKLKTIFLNLQSVINPITANTLPIAGHKVLMIKLPVTTGGWKE